MTRSPWLQILWAQRDFCQILAQTYFGPWGWTGDILEVKAHCDISYYDIAVKWDTKILRSLVYFWQQFDPHTLKCVCNPDQTSTWTQPPVLDPPLCADCPLDRTPRGLHNHRHSFSFFVTFIHPKSPPSEDSKCLSSTVAIWPLMDQTDGGDSFYMTTAALLLYPPLFPELFCLFPLTLPTISESNKAHESKRKCLIPKSCLSLGLVVILRTGCRGISYSCSYVTYLGGLWPTARQPHPACTGSCTWSTFSSTCSCDTVVLITL